MPPPQPATYRQPHHGGCPAQARGGRRPSQRTRHRAGARPACGAPAGANTGGRRATRGRARRARRSWAAPQAVPIASSGDTAPLDGRWAQLGAAPDRVAGPPHDGRRHGRGDAERKTKRGTRARTNLSYTWGSAARRRGDALEHCPTHPGQPPLRRPHARGPLANANKGCPRPPSRLPLPRRRRPWQTRLGRPPTGTLPPPAPVERDRP